jgi:hydroxyethylthiazole kinase-like uncharacterized protein yjeF
MITSTQMKKLEHDAEKKGVSRLTLMENAGKQVYETIKERYAFENKHVVIFAGQGNNGGDGFVVARYCVEECPVIVLFFGSTDKLSEEAHANYDQIKDKVTVVEVHSKEDLANFKFQKVDLILVDALLGTGVQGNLREPIASGVDYFNKADGIKVAIDIPSGMDPDTGKPVSKCCNAELVVTFHDLKVGLKDMEDKTVVVDIGIPQ